MIVAPAGTPREIIARLNDELRRIVAEPDIEKEFSLRGFIPIVTPPPAELETFVKSEILRWGEVVKKAGAAGIE
jgi:tripartite-type tricarboxylate transporter receptor subunit TctC